MKIFKTILIIIAIIGVGYIICPTSPQSDASAVLKRTLLASQSRSYNAVQVLKTAQQNSKLSTGTFIVRCDNGNKVLYTSSLPEVRMQGSSPISFDKQCVPLIEGEDTVAGRQCWTLRLKPPSKTTPWQQYWVDKKTYVVLAQRRWQDNQITDSFYMKSVTYK